MSARASLGLVSRRVLDDAVIFGTLTAVAIAIMVIAGLWLAVARITRPGREAARFATSAASSS